MHQIKYNHNFDKFLSIFLITEQGMHNALEKEKHSTKHKKTPAFRNPCIMRWKKKIIPLNMKN